MSPGSGRAPRSASHGTSSTSGYGAGDGGARKRAAGGDLGAAGEASAMGSCYGSGNWKSEVEMNGSAIDGWQSQQQNDPSRLLTLPTVLTIGRVVAVPILVSSRCSECRSLALTSLCSMSLDRAFNFPISVPLIEFLDFRLRFMIQSRTFL